MSTAEKSERPEENRDLRCQSGPSAKDSVIFSGKGRFERERRPWTGRTESPASTRVTPKRPPQGTRRTRIALEEEEHEGLDVLLFLWNGERAARSINANMNRKQHRSRCDLITQRREGRRGAGSKGCIRLKALKCSVAVFFRSLFLTSRTRWGPWVPSPSLKEFSNDF